jgi:hypothetical protein
VSSRALEIVRPRRHRALLCGPSTSPLGIGNPITTLIARQGGNVTKRVSRIAPWQAGKLFALIYFFLSLLFVVPLVLVSALVPIPAGPGHRLGTGFLIFVPFLYALAGLIFVPLGCWIYNMAAKVVGGLQVSVTDDADT